MVDVFDEMRHMLDMKTVAAHYVVLVDRSGRIAERDGEVIL